MCPCCCIEEARHLSSYLPDRKYHLWYYLLQQLKLHICIQLVLGPMTHIKNNHILLHAFSICINHSLGDWRGGMLVNELTHGCGYRPGAPHTHNSLGIIRRICRAKSYAFQTEFSSTIAWPITNSETIFRHVLVHASTRIENIYMCVSSIRHPVNIHVTQKHII